MRAYLHDEHRLVGERDVGHALVERVRGVPSQLARRARDGLNASDVQGDDEQIVVLDDFAGLARRVRAEGSKRPVDRAEPCVVARIRVMISRHQGDAIGVDACAEQRAGELLVFTGRADLREIS